MSEATAPPPNKAAMIISWATAILVSLAFGPAGVVKLVAVPDAVAEFVTWGYPDWFRIVVGVIEVVAVVLLLVPRSRLIGAAVAVVTMLGAVATHLKAAQYDHLPPPIILFALAVACAVFTRKWRASSSSR
jgi:putative oxidoreductase